MHSSFFKFSFSLQRVLFLISSCKKLNQSPGIRLCDKLVWNWSEENWFGWIRDDASGQWSQRFALQDDAFALSESLATLLVVGLHAGQEFVTALRGLDVLGANVDALGEDLSAVTLVHDDTQCVRCDVVDASGLAVVSLEWHALVNCSVALKRKRKD